MPSRESVDKIAAKSAKAVRAHLKEMGIGVPDVDGASSEAGLHALQHMQAIEKALDDRKANAQTASTATTGYAAGTDWASTAAPSSDIASKKAAK